MVTPRKPRTSMPPAEKVIADHAAGMTPKQMRLAYGVSQTPITKLLQKLGLSRKRKLVYPDDHVIVAGLQQHETIANIAARFGMSRDALRLHIVDRGLRDFIDAKPPVAEPPRLRPSPIKVINDLGVSIPRIPTIHGIFEVQR